MIEPTDKIGNITLYNADCMEVMKKFKDKEFDLAIVDPPYGINFSNTHTGKGWIVRDNKTWDSKRPNKTYFDELFRISKNQIIWGGNYFVEYLYSSHGWIFWDKGQRNFSLADGELAFTSFNRALRTFYLSRAKLNSIREKFHPTEKPVQLYEWLLLNYAKEGDTILDTHFGSLSIGIACEKLGFELTAIELDKDYYQMAKKRLLDYKNQLTIEF
jgi:site-specific DNA-methyltransferase (adenine-specific)